MMPVILNLTYCLVALLALAPAASRQQTLLPGELEALDEPTGYFAPNALHATYSQRLTFEQYLSYSLRALAQVAGYDNDLHRYDDQQHLIDSFERRRPRGGVGAQNDESRLLNAARLESSEALLLHNQTDATLAENELNQAQCARQLDLLFKAARGLFSNYAAFTQSRRLDLIDFLDSFGAAPGEQLLMGNSHWLGSYAQCRRARVLAAPAAPADVIAGRYCVAKLRLPSWSRGRDEPPAASNSSAALNATAEAAWREPAPPFAGDFVKLGVCLPRACNSISVLRHANRLEALIKLVRLQQVPYSSARLHQLYCLPDEASPLRQLSASARLFLALVGAWLALVLYASVAFQYAQSRAQLNGARAPAGQLEQIFAFQLAWRKLFDIHEASQASNAGAALVAPRQSPAPFLLAAPPPALGGRVKATIVIQERASVDARAHQAAGYNGAPQSTEPISGGGGGDVKRENDNNNSKQQLDAIDGIKVLSMIWLISAHTMLFFIRTISNGRDFWALILDFRFLTIMAGIFPVDSFFTITGALFAYLKFSGAGCAALRTRKYWLELFCHRYLRFMPMYLLIFWYTRDVSEFLGQGPMWDYATASTSLRAVCKRESLLVPLLFQANFKPIDQHCVKPAWYLANDYQYLLVTPLFMLALILSKWLGYLLLTTVISASYALQFLTVFRPQPPDAASAPFADFGALVNFRPMFATYVLKDLWRLYVLPYNRIAPYLVGLLTGHLMYEHNKRRLQQQRRAQQAAAAPLPTSSPLVQTCPSPTLSTHSSDSLALSSLSASSSSSSSSSGVSSHEDSASIERETSGETPGETAREPSAGAQAQRKPAGELRSLANFLRRGLIDFNVWAPLALLLAVIYLPLATKLGLAPLAGERARLGASLTIATMRLVWSLAIGRLIYVCFAASTARAEAPPGASETAPAGGSSSSFVLDLLSSRLWRPWSKIGLSVLLIQWEVIGYVAQIQTSAPFMSISFLLAMVFTCIIISYALGLLLYLTFEFPLAQLELLHVRPRLFGARAKAAAS